MKWRARFLFGALLAGVLLLKFEVASHSETASPDPAQRLALVLGTRLARPVEALDPPTLYRAHLRGCAAPVTVAVTRPTFTERAFTSDLAKPGDRTFYAFLDWLSAQPDRLAVVGRMAGQPVLALVGLSRFEHAREMLTLVEPHGCDVVGRISWDRYWSVQ